MTFKTCLYALALGFIASIAVVNAPASATKAASSYSKIVLWAPGFTAEDQAKIEKKSIRAFTKKGVDAVPMSSLINNVGQLTNAEILLILRDQKIQAIMTLTDRKVRQSRISNKSTTPRIAESILINQAASTAGSGGGATIAGDRGTVGMGGQVYKERNQITFGVVLTDLTIGQQVWQGNFVIKSRLENNATSMAGMALRKAAKKAIKDGILAPAS